MNKDYILKERAKHAKLLRKKTRIENEIKAYHNEASYLIENDMTYKIKMTTEPDREVEAMRLGIDHRVMVTLRDLTIEDASLVAKLVSQLDAKRKGK